MSDTECEDPFIQHYSGEGVPDYASWINQRPLPIQPIRAMENTKPTGQDIQVVDPCIRSECFGNAPLRTCHIYESPKFDRRLSARID